MLRSVLVALNGTASSDAASELAIRSSKHYGCTLTGIGFVDDPGLRDYHLSGHSHATTMLYDEALKQARTQIKDMLELFERRCQSANIVVHAVSCENEPYEDLAFEAVRHDIVMIGSEASIHRCREGYDVLDMLKHVPRPIVVVPELLPDGDVVLIAYDGSVQAGRTLQAFLASGLCRNRSLTVVSVDKVEDRAVRQVKRAVEYLRLHDIEAEECPIASHDSAEKVLGKQANDLAVGLIVMGAYGKRPFQEFLFGSVTSHFLEDVQFPLFIYH